MNPARWAEISRLFTAISEQPPARWTGLLDEYCAQDPELRCEVERLLESERHRAWDPARPMVRIARALQPGDFRPVTPLRAGPYRLLHPIGWGSRSEVYLAVRDDDAYRRQVAVKLIRPGEEGRSLLRRFRAERQILANLDHPNIARLYDGGIAEDGRPYLAMEYVDGLPVTEYCARRRLDPSARLRIFLDVCSAVQHAHQNLLVHRDLKPGNILVSADGVAKLLDFGIAKPLGPLEGLEPRATRTGHRPMTPTYASPEQVRGDAITTASDVYALGVLLFELLTGRRPYRLSADLPYELERAICEQEAPRPSQVVESGARGRLRGDLDAIVAKALRKEPARRYYSVRELAGDVERHLADRPIRARRDGALYRLGKFARRHRGPVLAACGAIVLIAGLLALVAWQAREVEASRSRAERVSERLLARLSTGETEDQQFDDPVPRGALDLSLALDGRMLDDPAALAEMLEVMGRLHQQAGLTEDAHWMLEEALGLRRRHVGEEDLLIASSLHSFGASLLRTGEPDRGEELVREALELRRRESGGATWAIAESLEVLGRHSWSMGRLDEAETLFEESLEVRLEICPDSAWTARGLSDLAEFRLERQELAQAEPLQARAASIRSGLSSQHFDQPRGLEDRGLLEFARGEVRLAGELFRQAAEARRRRVGTSHPALSRALVWQARALIPQGRYREAVDALREALSIHRRLQLGDGAAQADLLKHLGFALAADGDPDAGEAMLRGVIERESARLSPAHPRVAISRLLLADALYARGDLQLAEELYLRASAELAEHPRWEYGAGAEPPLALVGLRLDRGDTDGAVREARRVLSLLREHHPAGHWRLARALRLLSHAQALNERAALRPRPRPTSS